MLDQFRRLYAYNAWANGRLLAALAAAAPSHVKVDVFQHLLSAETEWLRRLRGGAGSPVPLWTEPSAQRCQELAAATSEGFAAWLAALGAQGLPRSVSYQNTRGERYTTPVEDVLQHVLLHSARHRGEVAAALGDAGAQAPDTDLIVWLRTVEGR